MCCVGVGGKGVSSIYADFRYGYLPTLPYPNISIKRQHTTQQLDLTTMVGIFDLGPAVLMFYWDTISRTIVYDQIYKEAIPLYGMGIKRYTTVWSDRRPMKDLRWQLALKESRSGEKSLSYLFDCVFI